LEPLEERRDYLRRVLRKGRFKVLGLILGIGAKVIIGGYSLNLPNCGSS